MRSGSPLTSSATESARARSAVARSARTWSRPRLGQTSIAAEIATSAASAQPASRSGICDAGTGIITEITNASSAAFAPAAT